MGYRKEYGELLEAIAKEAEAIAMRYFRAAEMRVERKHDGSAVTQADREVEEMARAKVTASGLALDVLGEEMGDGPNGNSGRRARLIIDPIDGTDEFSRGIPTFLPLRSPESPASHAGTGISRLVASLASNPAITSSMIAQSRTSRAIGPA